MKKFFIKEIEKKGVLPFDFTKNFTYLPELEIFENLLFQNSQEIRNLYRVHLIENEKLNEFTVIIGLENKLLSFKMIFLLNKIKEIISYNKAMKKTDDLFESLTSFKHEPFLLIEVHKKI